MRYATTFLLFLLLTATAMAQGISFFQGSWEEALAKAQAEDKIIFVDAYAEWCGPCKRMAATVFPDPEVGAFFNRHFVSLKIDMEKPENQEFRAKYPVSAFPTLFFISGEGEIVKRVVGALSPADIIAAAQSAMADAEPVEDYAAAYEEGDRSPELIYKYVRSLIRNGESHLRVANDYLREQTDLNTPENVKIILISATEADSRIFKLMVERRDRIAALESEEVFLGQVWAACQATATKAIEFSSPDLLAEAVGKMEEYYPAQAKAFELESAMDYAEAHYDTKGFVRAARDYARSVAEEDADALRELGKRLASKFGDDDRAMKLAVDVATQAAEVGGTWREYYELAKIELQAGQLEDAKESAQEALNRAEMESPSSVLAIRALIRQIEEG